MNTPLAGWQGATDGKQDLNVWSLRFLSLPDVQQGCAPKSQFGLMLAALFAAAFLPRAHQLH